MLILSDHRGGMVTQQIWDPAAPTFVLLHYSELQHFEPVVMCDLQRLTVPRKLLNGLYAMFELMGCDETDDAESFVEWALADEGLVGVFPLKHEVCQNTAASWPFLTLENVSLPASEFHFFCGTCLASLAPACDEAKDVERCRSLPLVCHFFVPQKLAPLPLLL